MQKLECAVQNYEWGKPANESIVAKIKCLNTTENNKPYAELWMGTHPNGPSKIISENQNLSDYIKSNIGCVGKHEKDGIQYLFKVLSVNKALSVQTHPTKEQAIILNKNDPQHYPDDNHKPELAIALTDFEILSGFRLSHEIISNFKAYTELLELIDERDLENLAVGNSDEINRTALKALFSSIWKSPQIKIVNVVEKIVERILKKESRLDIENLILRLNNQFPGGDVGVLAPLFLNHFTLKPGEAVFIGPNIPHAYLFGDCIECMACSDNTIRAGLTPKFKDIQILCENLTYEMTPPPYFKPFEKSKGVVEYAPPVKEFSVQRINNEANDLDIDGASSIIVVIAGNSTLSYNNFESNVKCGEIWFLPYSADSNIKFIQSTNDFLCFRAFTPQH